MTTTNPIESAWRQFENATPPDLSDTNRRALWNAFEQGVATTFAAFAMLFDGDGGAQAKKVAAMLALSDDTTFAHGVATTFKAVADIVYCDGSHAEMVAAMLALADDTTAFCRRQNQRLQIDELTPH
jgi:hypothetical protein